MRAVLTIIFVFSSLAIAESSPLVPVHALVKLARTHYRLDYDRFEIKYSNGPHRYAVKVQLCNREESERFVRAFLDLKKFYLKRNASRMPKKTDVEVREGSARPIKVSKSSSFGTWLSDLPKQFPSFASEALVLCKKH